MCVYCYMALGAVVGGVALAKAGSLGAAKTAVVAFVSHYLLLRR